MSPTFPLFGEQATSSGGGWLELDGGVLEMGGTISFHRQLLRVDNLGEGAVTAHWYFGNPGSLGSTGAANPVKHF